MTEVWKDIKGFEGYYQVSNFGKVKALSRTIIVDGIETHRKERMLSLKPNGYGYVQVVLCKNGKTFPIQVHRLVALAFITNKDNKPYIDHIDCVRNNNCVENLKWCTPKENNNNPITKKHNSESKIGHKRYGKIEYTDELRKKLGDSKRGKPLSKEHRKKLSEAHKGKSAWNKGKTYTIKKRSEEFKAYMQEKIKI